MAQNRNNQHDEEESEYRFSDDEISYEVEESEPTKASQIKSSKKEFKLSRFKRLIMSAVFFLILFIIVYKMIAPSSTTVPEIAAVPTQSATRPAQVAKPGTSVASIDKAAQVNIDKTGLPAFPSTTDNQAASGPGQMTLPLSQSGGETDTRLAAMAVENEKRINQLSADYNQKLNDVVGQNKQLQEQVQLLSAKVGSLETQMNQLVQVLIKQSQNSPSAAEGAGTRVAAAQTAEAPITYNVQAIIPGRAWLKSDSGETVTVAEGEMIKGLGRVTKIDPYDGIVEVNTGSKAVSLSYGSNG